jgi:hypothetical protein
MGCDIYWLSFLSFVMQFYVGKYMVLLVGELIASVIIDQIKVPENTNTGYGTPVSESLTVPVALKKIQTNAEVMGVIKAQIIPK